MIYQATCETCNKTQDYWASIEERHKTPRCCGGRRMAKILSPTRGTVDITPYWTVAHDKETNKPEYITGRKQHRDFVKRNGFEEVGSQSTIPRDAIERMQEKRYVAGELDDSVNALP